MTNQFTGNLCHTIIAKRVYRGDDNFAKIYLILHSLFLLHQVMLYSKGIGNEGKGCLQFFFFFFNIVVNFLV